MLQSSITTWLQKPAAVTAPVDCKHPSLSPLPLSPPSLSSSPPSPPSLSPSPSSPLTDPPPAQHLDPAVPTASASVLLAQHGAAALSRPFANLDNPSLIANIALEPCTKTHMSAFRRLNTLLLPIPYPSNFYHETLSDPVTQNISLVAIWRDDPTDQSPENTGRVIGGIRCRLLSGPDPDPASPSNPMLYISTICVLSPYRGYGVASHLLRAVTTTAIHKYRIRAVGAHVWEMNDDGRRWYQRKGFVEERLERGYYRRLSPQGAYVVTKTVGPGDLLRR